MNRITLDFENSMVTIETDAQQGTHFHPGLAALQPQILTVLGYEKFNLDPVVTIFENLINGQISRTEAEQQLDKYISEEQEPV